MQTFLCNTSPSRAFFLVTGGVPELYLSVLSVPVNHVHQMCFCACLIIAYLYTPLGMVSHRLSLSCFAPFHERQWERWASCRNKRASLDLFACLLKELGPLLDVGSHQRSFFTAHWGYLAHDPVYDLLQLCLVFVQFPLQDDQRQRWRWF